MVARAEEVSTSPSKPLSCNKKENVCETSSRGSLERKSSNSTSNNTPSEKPPMVGELNGKLLDLSSCEACCDISEASPFKESHGLKRKGDIEFQMQLEMALTATAVGTNKSSMSSDMNSSSLSDPPVKRLKTIERGGSSTSDLGISTAVGSKKVGAPLYWAEVYCSGENLTGKWVHVDAVNAIIDGEQKVEAAATACKTSLRYVVAFAGRGAKDVTRRLCILSYYSMVCVLIIVVIFFVLVLAMWFLFYYFQCSFCIILKYSSFNNSNWHPMEVEQSLRYSGYLSSTIVKIAIANLTDGSMSNLILK